MREELEDRRNINILLPEKIKTSRTVMPPGNTPDIAPVAYCVNACGLVLQRLRQLSSGGTAFYLTLSLLFFRSSATAYSAFLFLYSAKIQIRIHVNQDVLCTRINGFMEVELLLLKRHRRFPAC
jgi:hypothetical protein